MPQISIVIPMYNEERYIARCLDSLQMQTMKDFEIILIDDGSTDKSISIASTYKDKLSLTILEQKHGGPGRARNWGASIAKGDILVFVDADMAFDERYIEELVKPIVEGDENGTAHGWEYIANEHHPLARAYGMIRLAYDETNLRGGVFRAIKKDVFLSNSGYNDDRYAFEDDMGEKIGKALYVPTAICYHNNPETLNEIFGHEVWIGESLVAKGMLRTYIKKYAFLLSVFGISVVVAISLAIYLEISLLKLFLAIVCILFFLIMVVSIRRSITERYISHLLFIPIVIITRGFGYIRGILRYLFSHNNK